MRHNPSLRLPWFAPGKRIEGAIDSALYQFATYSFTRLPWVGMVNGWTLGAQADTLGGSVFQSAGQCVSVGRIVLTAPRRASQPCCGCGWGRGGDYHGKAIRRPDGLWATLDAVPAGSRPSSDPSHPDQRQWSGDYLRRGVNRLVRSIGQVCGHCAEDYSK
jgi:hypothetical protein